MLRCAVFASGGGSNFQSLIDRKKTDDLHVELSVLIVNNSGAGAVVRAKDHKIPVVHCAPSHFEEETHYVNALKEHLEVYKVDLLILAGYMKKLPVKIVQQYQNRIINIHPGLLPSFGGLGMYGKRVHKAVLDCGAKISGITVHFVDDEYDHGPIIHQAVVPVKDDDTTDTLAARVLAVEHEHYWKVVEAIGQGVIRVEGQRVFGEV